jgi:transposase-like protein
MTRKIAVTISTFQKLEYAKLMVEQGYTNKQIEDMSGAGKSAVSRWKWQYQSELAGKTPENTKALTEDQRRIQLLEAQLKQAMRDNEILKKAAAFFIRDNQNLK